jgi:hypothetical protein
MDCFAVVGVRSWLRRGGNKAEHDKGGCQNPNETACPPHNLAAPNGASPRYEIAYLGFLPRNSAFQAGRKYEILSIRYLSKRNVLRIRSSKWAREDKF